MEAARITAQRGHDVTLYERESRLGGQLIQAAVPPHKSEITRLIQYLEDQIRKLDVRVELNKDVTPEIVEEFKPDAIVVATGSSPVDPDIPGISEAKVVYAGDVLDNKVEVGERVVIIGGELVGCETAEYLAENGREVTVARRGAEMATRVGPTLRPVLLKRLADNGVKLLPGVKYEGITSSDLVLTTKDGLRKTIEADTIILAAGSQPNKRLFEELKGMASEIYLVGDCVEPRTIRDAINEGFRVGCKI
jgi:pyruvate/2-oxoglutarate dehydrogenase complex dihydrolipoamide dehydrogenase (E3) component